ncbi:MAG: prolyl oligopeptidase family serine peptidase, partial [Planctomycetota bacterium]
DEPHRPQRRRLVTPRIKSLKNDAAGCELEAAPRPFRSSLFLIAMLAAILVLSSLPAEPEYGADAAAVYKTADDLKNGGTVDLKLHFFLPEGKGERSADGPLRPGVVFYFGGGWNGGTAGHFAPQARPFANRGMVAAVAEYRVRSRNGVKADGCVRDARDAFHAFRELAEKYRIDPDRIAAGGGSAGGHLAAVCGIVQSFPDDPQGFQPADALLLFNPGVICAPYRSPTGDTATLDGWMKRGLPAGGDERLSPIHHLDQNDPPTLILHGADDTTVPARSVTLFQQAAAEQGVRCDLALFADAGHGFFNQGRFQGDKGFETTLRLADEFLVSLGWLNDSDDPPGDEPAYRWVGR